MVASIVQLGRLQSGDPAAVLKADRRVKIGSGVSGPGTALWVEAEELDPTFETDEIRKLAAEYKSLLIATLQRRDAWQVIDTVNKVTDPSPLADLAGYASWLSDEQKRQLLETPDVADRLRVLVEWGKDHLAETEVNDKIADDVREGMEKSQREFLLRQQLNAIRKELGEDEPEGAQDYRARVEAADLPDDVRKAALREVGKLERAATRAPSRAASAPGSTPSSTCPGRPGPTDSTDIRAAREVLDADHHGLDDVKDRIVEYLAVRARRASRGLELVGGRGSGAVMALAGPPGVGKTSLGESVARALGRKFVRVALGGVRDEAEIRGHRRTYVGALPGRIVRAISEAGSMNPVVLLDEIDKVGSDYRGDPSAALLEVLDPAQNHTFRDHYLEVDLDLSDVLFLATANVVENIPQALLDRMELVTLDGYTEDDKVAIARDFLLPRQLERAALTADEVQVDDDALREIAADYTREPGVRQLERLLAKALRKATTQAAPTATEATRTGPLRHHQGQPARVPRPAAVHPGGARADLGARRGHRPRGHRHGWRRPVHRGQRPAGLGRAQGGGLTLTGQLGDVMKESAQIALSYVRAHAAQLGITDPSVLDRHDPHARAGRCGPEGRAVRGRHDGDRPDLDGAGRPVRSEVGMTGEVTLNGRVLPIGGVKQKLLAAQRAGLTTVFLPKRNEPDLDEVPTDVTDAIEVILTSDVATLVAAALEPATSPDGGRRGLTAADGRQDRRRS